MVTATDYLKAVNSPSSQGFYFQFSKVEILLDDYLVTSFEGSTSIRQDCSAGGQLTILDYSEVLEKIQDAGALKDFAIGDWTFFASWITVSERPLVIEQDEYELGVTAITMEAVDSADEQDVVLNFNRPPYTIRFSRCTHPFEAFSNKPEEIPDTGSVNAIPDFMIKYGHLNVVFEADQGARRQAFDNNFGLWENQTRIIEVVPNVNGIPGYGFAPSEAYLLTRIKEVVSNVYGIPGDGFAPGEAYLLTVYDPDNGRQTLTTKQMKIVGYGFNYVELKGGTFMSVMMNQDDYALRIYHNNEEVCGVWIRRCDTGNDYFYSCKKFNLIQSIRISDENPLGLFPKTKINGDL